MLRFLTFLAVVLAVRSASAPFITPCAAEDNACIKSSAQAAIPTFALGIPALGIKSLDPMQLDVVKGDQAGLTLTLTDTTVTGMKDCTVESIKHQLNKGKQVLTVQCSVDMVGNYNLSGQILVLPIRGDGRYHIRIRDIIIKTSSQVVTVDGADGKKHWHVNSYKFTYQVKTNAHFEFENLFNGNKALSKPVEDFMNTNWRDVMKEVAHPIVKAIVDRVVEAVEALYKAVPAEELEIA